jgi:hypothetical protein
MDANLEWLQQRREHYRAHKNDMCEAIKDFDNLSKLGQGFTSVDPLEEVDIGDGTVPRLLTVYIRIKLQVDLQADKSSVVVKGPIFPQL